MKQELRPGQRKVFLRDYKDRRGKVEFSKGTPLIVSDTTKAPLIEVQVLLDKGKSKITFIPESYIIE